MKQNYQLVLDKEIERITASEETPKLLLHSCCGPCSSYVLEYLTRYFAVTLYYYNPNIYPAEEYEKRLAEQKKIIREMEFVNDVQFAEGRYFPDEFYAVVSGLENEPEGGERCRVCFALRMEETAYRAAKDGFDYFTTTLSVSPHKNAQVINEIGGELSKKYNIKYLFSDFKKRDGYKRSIELSAEYGLYRQNYCGCEYSLREADGFPEK